MDYIDGRIVKKRVKCPDVRDARVYIENNHEGFSKELLRIICPYGIEASIEAAKIVSLKVEERQKLIQQKIKQLEYEATRAFEQ